MVDIKKLTITYPLKEADGSELIVKIENTPDLDETLGLFYAHTEPLSTGCCRSATTVERNKKN